MRGVGSTPCVWRCAKETREGRIMSIMENGHRGRNSKANQREVRCGSFASFRACASHFRFARRYAYTLNEKPGWGQPGGSQIWPNEQQCDPM
jgi:hypothetical protein